MDYGKDICRYMYARTRKIFSLCSMTGQEKKIEKKVQHQHNTTENIIKVC